MIQLVDPIALLQASQDLHQWEIKSTVLMTEGEDEPIPCQAAILGPAWGPCAGSGKALQRAATASKL